MLCPNLNRVVGLILSLVVTAGAAVAGENTSATWRYGFAQAKITPEKLFWMGGFAARKHPAEGLRE
jgi:hypothetical protein